MIFKGKISKHHNSVFLCTSSDHGLYLFHENILPGINVIEQPQFSKEKFQKGIIP